jgi:hypothetical protein
MANQNAIEVDAQYLADKMRKAAAGHKVYRAAKDMFKGMGLHSPEWNAAWGRLQVAVAEYEGAATATPHLDEIGEHLDYGQFSKVMHQPDCCAYQRINSLIGECDCGLMKWKEEDEL